MMTVLCVQCPKQACFVKAYYRPLVGCDSPVMGFTMAGGGWVVVVVWVWWGRGGVPNTAEPNMAV